MASTMYYDHELNLNANWNVDDNTIIYTQFEMRDESWASNNIQDYSYGTNPTSYNNTKGLDDNIVVEKVYVWHKFANGHQLRVGLMPSGTWGTAFADSATESYRIRYDIPINDKTTVLGLLEKPADNGEKSSYATGFGERDDTDAYYLGLITDINGINVAPVFVYGKAGKIADKYVGIVALNGGFGNLGFESEFAVTHMNYVDSTKDDTRVYGAYMNIWHQSGPVKAGILGAYGSYDDNANNDAAFGFGGDFVAGGAQILGDYLEFDFNETDTVKRESLDAGRLGALYADYSVNDKLTIGGYAGYAKCGADTKDKWDGAKAWEVSADAAYKITDNITYDVGAAVAQLKWGDSTTKDPDKASRVFHRFTVNF
jgi:hypothetical protein